MRWSSFLIGAGLWLVGEAGAQTNAVVLAADGAWTWYNDPRALFHQGVLYAGYVRAADGRAALTAYDPASGTATSLWASSWVQNDDHNNPALLPLEDGRLLALHARHSTESRFYTRLSLATNPATSSDWAAEQTITAPSTVSYQNPYRLATEPGRIFNFMRSINFNPTVALSTNAGNTWFGLTNLIRTGSGSIRPYVKYASDYTNRIDFLYTDGHPRDVTNSLYHAYYSNGAIWKTDGTLLKPWTELPLLHDAGERGSVIYQYSTAPTNDPEAHIPTGRAWCWETVLATNGWPVCVFTVQRDAVMDAAWSGDRIYYYWARWTPETGWQKRFIAQAGRPLYAAEDDYAGGIALDPDRPDTVYIASNADAPFDLSTTTNVPLRGDGRYRLFRGVTTNQGLTFGWTPVSPEDATVDYLRPYVPRFKGTNDCVLCFRGTYATYTTYAAEVVALFADPQVVPTNPPPPTNLAFFGQGVADWHAGRNTEAPSLDGPDTASPVVGASSSAVNAQVWGYFPPLALHTGVTIRLQGHVVFGQLPSQTGDQLRFGLFDPNGEVMDQARTFSTIGTTNVDDWRGLLVTVDNAASAGGGVLREFLGGTNIFMTASSRSVARGTYAEATFVALPANTAVTFRLDITRVGPTNFNVAGAFDGAPFSFPDVGTAHPFPRLGAMGWLNGGSLGVTSFALSNVEVGVVGDGPFILWSALRNLAPEAAGQDADEDGFANLLEYATGGDPTNAASGARLLPHPQGIVFPRDTNAVDVTLLVEGSDAVTNGASWIGLATNSQGHWGGASNVVESGTGTPATATVIDPVGGAHRFLRLRVTRP